MDKLQELPWKEYLAIAAKADQKLRQELGVARGLRRGFNPVVDGAILPQHPFHPEPAPTAAEVPMLISSTFNEQSPSWNDSSLEKVTLEEVGEKLKQRAGFGPGFGDKTREVVDAYVKAFPGRKPVEIWSLASSNRQSAVALADAKARQPAPVYIAWFGWQPPLFDGRMRAFHCLDICFWFHNTDLMLTHTGGGARPRKLASKMSGALVQFMKTGNPNGAGLRAWPRYTSARGETMVLDDVSEARDDPDRAARFAVACEREGVRPILGASLTLDGGAYVVLLARDMAGYSNLCRLITDAHMMGERGEPSLALAQVCAHANGLTALLGPRSPSGALALRGQMDAARRVLAPFREAFGENCFVAVENRMEAGSPAEVRTMLRLAESTDTKAVATNAVRYLVPEDAFLADALECMRRIVPIASNNVTRTNSEGYLKSAREMRGLFAERPDLCDATLDIAESCTFDIGLKQVHFPEFPTPAGSSPIVDRPIERRSSCATMRSAGSPRHPRRRSRRPAGSTSRSSPPSSRPVRSTGRRSITRTTTRRTRPPSRRTSGARAEGRSSRRSGRENPRSWFPPNAPTPNPPTTCCASASRRSSTR